MAVVIEDSPAGVAAANAAGMASVGLLKAGRTREDLAAAGAIVRSLSEISPPMLQDLIAQRPLPTGFGGEQVGSSEGRRSAK